MRQLILSKTLVFTLIASLMLASSPVQAADSAPQASWFQRVRSYVVSIIRAHREYPVTATVLQTGLVVGGASIAGPLTLGAVLFGPVGLALGFVGVLAMPAVARFLNQLRGKSYTEGKSLFHDCAEFYPVLERLEDHAVCTASGAPIVRHQNGNYAAYYAGVGYRDLTTGEWSKESAMRFGQYKDRDGYYYRRNAETLATERWDYDTNGRPAWVRYHIVYGGDTARSIGRYQTDASPTEDAREVSTPAPSAVAPSNAPAPSATAPAPTTHKTIYFRRPWDKP